MGFATSAKKASPGLGSLGAMMGGIGQPPKPKPKATGLGLGLGVGSTVGPPPSIRSTGGLSNVATPTGTAAMSGLGLVAGPSPGPGASAGSDPPVKVSTRLAVAEWLRAVGEQHALPEEDQEKGSSSPQSQSQQQHSSLSLLAFVLAYGAVDPASEVRRAMLAAGASLVDAYGPKHCPHIIAHLEGTTHYTLSTNAKEPTIPPPTVPITPSNTPSYTPFLTTATHFPDPLTPPHILKECYLLRPATTTTTTKAVERIITTLFLRALFLVSMVLLVFLVLVVVLVTWCPRTTDARPAWY